MEVSNTIVVFDLDETLGHFVEIGVFWDALQKVYGPQDSYHFFEVMDLFPEFLRPNIIDILSYLLEQKSQGYCDKLMIYTNNNGPKSWVESITSYFNYKLNTTVFDNIVAAFKVNGKTVEWSRTTNDKTVDDLLKCTNLPSNVHICFIDDQEHTLMLQSSVYYINVKPFHYSFKYKDMIERYINAFSSRIVDVQSFTYIMKYYMTQSYYEVRVKSIPEIDLDNVISKQLLLQLKDFFIHTRKEKKIQVRKHNTRKNNIND